MQLTVIKCGNGYVGYSENMLQCSREAMYLEFRVGEHLRYSIERYRRYSPFLYLICI